MTDHDEWKCAPGISPPAGRYVTRNDRAVIQEALEEHRRALGFADDPRYCAAADVPAITAEIAQVDRLLATITHWAPYGP